MPGTGIVMHKGDVIQFTLFLPEGEARPGEAWVRTNIGNAGVNRREIIDRAERGTPILDRDWHDIPMTPRGKGRYAAHIPLLEVGRFEAKAFFMPKGTAEPLWPGGANVVIKVEPAEYCGANAIYTAFVRQFGPNRSRRGDTPERNEIIRALEREGYAVIPRSGTFRDLLRSLDFIICKMRFRIIQLLPIHPTPTTYARMGRFGSPYAALDFMDVDPALAEFDQKTTPLDQFQELVDAIHERCARIFLDIPANHTGWASKLQIDHPEWFDRDKDMRFRSPGAWGVTWEDLAKLDYGKLELWSYMADVLLFWARRGVDGFRCDAGYMIPAEAWKYIVAKVRDEYPQTVFLLEGLGGKAETVQKLLFDSNMNWAYSELFQSYNRQQVEACLREAIDLSSTKGLFVHYAETHDNNRLASRSTRYARMRTALSALCSHEGAFGITNGVEWFAKEKIDVHDASALNWGSEENQADFIARLNAMLESLPAFHAGAEIRMIHQGDSNSIALLRRGPEPGSELLVLVNLEERPAKVCWNAGDFPEHESAPTDLISGEKKPVERCGALLSRELEAAEALCLSPRPADLDLVERTLKSPVAAVVRTERQRARALALEVNAIFGRRTVLGADEIERDIEEMLENPAAFCARVAAERRGAARSYAAVVSWNWPTDLNRVVMAPPGSLLYVRSGSPFIAELLEGKRTLRHEASIKGKRGFYFVLFPPLDARSVNAIRSLKITVFEPGKHQHSEAPVLFLSDWRKARVRASFAFEEVASRGLYALCADKHGAMAQVRGAWSEIRTQYDAILAGNLSPDCPVDRRVMLSRCRVWMVYQGYSQAINETCLDAFSAAPDGCVVWRFTVSAGQGKKVPLEFVMTMPGERNAVRLVFRRKKAPAADSYMRNNKPVRIIIRPDIEDRLNHEKTKAYMGPEYKWPGAVSQLAGGFMFSPSPDHQLRAVISPGTFVSEPEWKYSVPHPEDAERGFDGCSDLFSPGYFVFTLKGGESAALNAEILTPGRHETASEFKKPGIEIPRLERSRRLDEAMLAAMGSFVVKRGDLKTVIAGYPWFLDWGRDTLICLRGIIAAGMLDDACDILRQFGRFESKGTLPNMMCGDSDANRDTSDAPLWYCVACADAVRARPDKRFLNADCGGRTIRGVLYSIARHYINGTSNGIYMDAESGLVFSPSHFTWMDTNHPAGTPREGYPIEIQALWHHVLSFLAELEPEGEWSGLAELVGNSIIKHFFNRRAMESRIGLSDCLHTGAGGKARDAVADDALRPNQLLAITLGAVCDLEAALSILSACEELLVPGAIRSLADRPVKFAIPVSRDGQLLNDPHRPYWGRYEGDEDTRRKPAYHNGTAWTWLFPSYSEALFMVHGEPARGTALSILSSSVELINGGCVGHVPEITDGDRPHRARGCGAQAWGATELYRVFRKLKPNRLFSP